MDGKKLGAPVQSLALSTLTTNEKAEERPLAHFPTRRPLCLLIGNVCRLYHGLIGHQNHPQKDFHNVEVHELKLVLELCSVRNGDKCDKEHAVD